MTPGGAGLVLAVAALLVVPLASASSAAAATPTGPFLTLLFSRTEVTAANNCVEDDDNVARLDTVVAPALYALGLHPTGTVETGPTQQDSLWCDHYKMTLAASWDLEQQLASQYGWSFVSHSATYPHTAAKWSKANAYAETCGSEKKLVSEGLPGADGLFAWPDNFIYQPALSDVESCFDFNRKYGPAVTNESTAIQPPYTESTEGISGGACNDKKAACYDYTSPLATKRYTSPKAMEAIIAGAQSDQWVTLQSYLFVTGSQPGQWDCTSANWQDHWTDDGERYCWNDYLSIVKNLPADVTVTDPASVGQAWGRTAPGRTGVSTAALRVQSAPDVANSVYMWGGKGSSPGSYTTPTAVTGLSSVVQLDAEDQFNYALLSNGTVMAWGLNKHGELGDGTTKSSASPVLVKGLTNVVQVDGGFQCGLAVESDGSVWTWGNYKGGNATTPVQIAGLTNVVQVSAGGAHSLALLSNGTVMAWGENNDGQLGTGSTKKDAKPKRIPGLSGVTAVSAGNLFSAALLKDGTVMTWGNNAYGQLGDGSTVNSDVPVAVPGLSGVAQISAGGNLSTNGHMVALLNNGTVEAWGQNFYGQLGDGTTTSSSTPVVVGGSDPLSNVVAVSAGGMFSEALLSNGSVSVWGFKNGTLQTKQEDVLLPISVPHVSNAVLIWAGASTGLAGESTSGGS